MKKYLPYISISILVASGLIYFGFSKEERISSTNNRQTEQSTDFARETKKDDQASVTVSVTPVEMSGQSQEWKFDVVMDTHSVELDQDMTKITILVDDQGKEYKPISWDGPTGGHHREGILTFSKITPTPKSVELKISDIGGVIRTFNWQLK